MTYCIDGDDVDNGDLQVVIVSTFADFSKDVAAPTNIMGSDVEIAALQSVVVAVVVDKCVLFLRQ